MYITENLRLAPVGERNAVSGDPRVAVSAISGSPYQSDFGGGAAPITFLLGFVLSACPTYEHAYIYS